MKKFVLLSILLAAGLSGYMASDDDAGFIFDKISGSPLAYAHIKDKNDRLIGQNDEEGRFNVNIQPDDSIRLNASFIGYKKYKMSFTITSPVLLVAMTPDLQSLESVEVTALRSPININKPYVQTSVYENKIIEHVNTSVADILEFVPGLYRKAEYHSPIVLRGLSGKRLIVTLDGNRRMGSTSAGFTGQNINIFDLEKVEIIKGPSSVKYGPGAIAGIINMTSKAPFSQNGLRGRVMSTYNENNNEYSINANLSYSNEKHAFGICGRYMSSDSFRYANG